MTDSEQIFALLRPRVGLQMAISARQICDELGWSHGREREVRRIIADHSDRWRDGIVCSRPDGGFFLAATYDEVLAHHHHLGALHDASKGKLNRFRARCRAAGLHLPNLPRRSQAASA